MKKLLLITSLLVSTLHLHKNITKIKDLATYTLKYMNITILHN